MTGRSVPEWIGATADTKVPDHVRARVFLRDGGRCHISGRKIGIEPWDLDHVTALEDWTGEGHGNRESNLAPALRDKHLAKTARENSERAPVKRQRERHIGIKKPRTITQWRKFDGTPVRASRER